MKDKFPIIWVSRISLVLILIGAGIFALQPQFNTAPWTPNQTMRDLGLSYQTILAYEHNLHLYLHFLVCFLMTLLLYHAKFYFTSRPTLRMIIGVVIVVCLALATEFAQSRIDRDVELRDLVFGFSGISIAVLVLWVFSIKTLVDDKN